MKKTRALIAVFLVVTVLLTGCVFSKHADSGLAALPQQDHNDNVQGNTPESEDTQPENPLDIGRMEGGTYTNTYAGFGCTLDENWVYASSAELQEMPGDIHESMAGTDMGKVLESVDQFMDMQVSDSQTGSNFNVLYQKLDLQTRLAYAAMSYDDVLDVTLQQKDLLISSYETQGMTDISVEKIQVTFLGQTRPAMLTTGTINGIQVYITQIFEHQLGEYMVTLTATSFGEDTTGDMLDLFFPVD